MSRRITLFVLAASATLIATQASADRECFEDSCSLTAEQPTEVAPPPVEKATVADTSAPVAAAQAAAPGVESHQQEQASAKAAVAKPEAVKVEASRAEPPKVAASAEPVVAKPLKIETVNAEAAKEEASPLAPAKIAMPVATVEPSKPSLPVADVETPKPSAPIVKVEAAKPVVRPPKVEVVHALAPTSERPRVVVAEPSRPPVAMTPSPVEHEPVRLVRHHGVAPRASA